METSGHYAFAYQPVLNADQASVAVELIYRHAAPLDGDEAATAANAVLSAFIHAGLDDLLRLRRAFVPANEQLLASDLLHLLPADRFALEVSAPVAAKMIERCQQLREQGYRLIVEAGEGRSLGPAAAVADVVMFDGPRAAIGGCESLIEEAWGGGAQLYARGVETQETFDTLQRKGFHLYQGYYFAHRQEVSGERADPRKLAVLEVLAKLAGDADDRVLEGSFKTDPVLSIHLLRLVNSSAFALPTPIRSLKHAFSILGRQQLARWLQVLLYVLDGESEASPLLELALRRARFMEFVLTYRTHQEHSLLQDEAYMIGLLSLADVLMGWPMERIVERLHLAEELKAALVERRGPLGRLIELCEKLEQADFEGAEAISSELQLTEEAIVTAQQEALVWAHRVIHGAPPEEVPAEGAAGTASAAGDAEG